MAEVVFLLGGNVGDKFKIFDQTRKLISARIGVITKQSSIYATEPWGFESELFWNQAMKVTTPLNPPEVLFESQLIEKKMGRTRSPAKYESRTIDIDLLFYDDLLMDTPDLSVPHPRMGQRRFVLVPLNEISPDKRHPATGLTVREMLELCPDQLKVERIV